MFNHRQYMMKVEELMHGAMTRKERLEKINNLVELYRIDIEERTNLPYRIGIEKV